jgi:tetratricopeptide (TPR) repeat protein
MAKVWEEKDNKFLKENYLNYSNQELADMFNVTKKSIQGKLRRLGLHRKEDLSETREKIASADVSEVQKEKPDEKPLLRRKRLSSKVPVARVETPSVGSYRSVELTEKRKRAIREFSNALNILAKGDKETAKKELVFICENFPKELDIVERAKSWVRILSKAVEKPLETPEDYYIKGVELAEKNKLDQALEHFNKSLELDAEYVDAEYNIACLYCRLGDHEKALDVLWSLSELNDGFIESAMNDEDFEPMWENESFIELVQGYLEEHSQ